MIIITTIIVLITEIIIKFWSPEGVGGEEEEQLFFLSRRSIVSDWSLCLVGCFSPSVVTSPYLWPGARRFLTSCKKAKVTQSWRQSRIFDFHTKLHESESWVDSSLFVCLCVCCGFIFSTSQGVGWPESARPNENIQISERQPLIAVTRDNIQHNVTQRLRNLHSNLCLKKWLMGKYTASTGGPCWLKPPE